MASKEAIEKRREDVKKLYFIEGKTLDEISKIYGTTIKTIFDDIQVIKEDIKKELEANRFSLIERISLSNKERIKELWGLYNNTNSQEIKRKLLQDMRNEDTTLINNLQNLGVLNLPIERTENINSEISITEQIDKIMEEYEKEQKEKEDCNKDLMEKERQEAINKSKEEEYEKISKVG